MPIVLAGASSEECERLIYRCKNSVNWRNAERVEDSAGLLDSAEAPTMPMVRSAMEGSQLLQELAKPLEVLVGCKAKSRVSHLAKTCVATHLPPNSLVRLSEGVYTCSPEFRFLKLARTRYLPAHLVSGLELCGIHLAYPESEDGFVECTPRTTPALLKEFLAGCEGEYGVQQSRRVLPYLIPNSRSPMESVLAAILVLPARWGGYGLKGIELNVPIKGVPAGVYGAVSSYKTDIFFPDINLDIEYDGWRHSLPGARSSDNHRRIMLENAGVTVVTLSYEDASGVSTMNAIVERIRRARGIRATVPSRETLLARNELFASLMPAGTRGCNPAFELERLARRGRG